MCYVRIGTPQGEEEISSHAHKTESCYPLGLRGPGQNFQRTAPPFLYWSPPPGERGRRNGMFQLIRTRTASQTK